MLVLGALVVVVVPAGLLFMGHQLVQQLRGKRSVEGETLFMDAALIGMLGAAPTGGLLAWLISLTSLPGRDTISFVVYVAFAASIGIWAYRRLRRLYDEQTGQRVA